MKRQWSIVVLLALVFGVMAVGVGADSLATGSASQATFKNTLDPSATSEWAYMTVDLDGHNSVSLALDSAGTPHITYFANDEYSAQDTPTLRYAVKQGSNTWITEEVIEIEYPEGSAFVLDGRDAPHVTYSSLGGDAKNPLTTFVHAFKLDGSWRFEEMDVVENPCRRRDNGVLLIDSSEALHFFYTISYRRPDGRCGERLRYANRVGNNNWQDSTVYEDDNSLPFAVNIDSEDILHLAFTSYEDGIYSLQYSKFSSIDQFSPTVIFREQSGRGMGMGSIALDSSNYPRIALLGNGTSGGYHPVSDLYMMHLGATGWILEDTGKRRPYNDILAFFDAQGRAHVVSSVSYGGGIFGWRSATEHYYEAKDGWQEEEITGGSRSFSFAPDRLNNIHGASIRVANSTDAQTWLAYFNKPGDALTYSLSGQVTTPNGAPLAGVEISTAAGHATTDATGHYTITGLPAGTYNVGPTLTGYSFTPLTRSVTVPPDSEGVDFIAYPQGAYSVSGRVTTEEDRPLQGVRVIVGPGHGDITDANGHYTITALDARTYEITATLAGYAFTPIAITPHLSTAEVDLVAKLADHALDIRFRSQPHGYSFRNGDIVPTPDDFTLLDYQRMLGDQIVCRRPNPVGGACLSYKLISLIQYETLKWERKNSCFGMSVSSLRYYENPSLLPGSSERAFDLDVAEARREIAYYQMSQYLQPISGHLRQQRKANSTLTLHDVLTAIETAFRNREGIVLNMDHKSGSGHAVVPYALDNLGSNIWRVMVYDNNHPSPYESDSSYESERYVEIDLVNDTWSYNVASNEVWQGRSADHSLYTLPLSVYDGQASQPSTTGRPITEVSQEDGVEEIPFSTIWLSGNSHLLITDSQGRQLGFVDNELVSEIPEAAPIVPIEGPDVALEPIYVVPANETYTILVGGQAVGRAPRADTPASVTQFGPDFLVSVDNIPLKESTQDRLTITADGSGVAYQASQFAQPDLTLIFEDETSSSQFKILSADVGMGQSVSLEADPDTKHLVFNSADANGGAYDLAITLADTTAEHHFQSNQIGIGAGDTHYIDYSDWNGNGSIKLRVDEGSDGTIDEEHELGDELPSYQIFLAVISRP